MRFNHFVVYLLPKEEPEKNTYVNGNTIKEGQGNGACSSVIHTVEEKANVLEAEEPSVRRCTCAIHNAVCHAFDGIVPPFGWVLLLLVGFTLPSGDK